jgi:hypothetical protein
VENKKKNYMYVLHALIGEVFGKMNAEKMETRHYISSNS